MIPFPPKRILVPMDLSDLSFRALSQAMLLAETFGAKLEVLHVVGERLETSPHLWDEPPDRSARDYVAAEIRERAGAAAPVRILSGDPASAILHAAYLNRVGLIVMGSHGRGGVGRLLLGSVAEAVVRRAPCPTLVVRGQPGRIRSILAPVNLTDYSREAFLYAGKLSQRLEAWLTMLHVAAVDTDAAPRRMRTWRAALSPKARHLCTIDIRRPAGSVADTIADEAWERDAVVLAVHRRGAWRDLLLGTTAEQVLRRCPSLVFAVPPAAMATERERERWLKLVHVVNR